MEHKKTKDTKYMYDVYNQANGAPLTAWRA